MQTKPATEFIKISPKDTSVYQPAGHEDTFNRRLIGSNSGARFVEVILGEMGSNGTADAHAHEGFEQILYMLDGTLKIISKDRIEWLEPGDLGFIPAGVTHQVLCQSKRAKFIVIYAPPREQLIESSSSDQLPMASGE